MYDEDNVLELWVGRRHPSGDHYITAFYESKVLQFKLVHHLLDYISNELGGSLNWVNPRPAVGEHWHIEGSITPSEGGILQQIDERASPEFEYPF